MAARGWLERSIVPVAGAEFRVVLAGPEMPNFRGFWQGYRPKDRVIRLGTLTESDKRDFFAAIDLFGDHLPQGGLQSARGKIVKALGHDPSEEGLEIAGGGGGDAEVARVVNEAIAARRVLDIQYYKENEDQFTKRSVEPYRLENGREGWYAECYDLTKKGVRHFKLDRIKEATARCSGSTARASRGVIGGRLRRRRAVGGDGRRRRGSDRAGLRLLSLV